MDGTLPHHRVDVRVVVTEGIAADVEATVAAAGIAGGEGEASPHQGEAVGTNIVGMAITVVGGNEKRVSEH